MNRYEHNIPIDPSQIPDICTTSQLIEIGVFQDTRAANHIMRHMVGPKGHWGRHGHIFRKDDIIVWLESLGRIAK